jgi:hypothetical protein
VKPTVIDDKVDRMLTESSTVILPGTQAKVGCVPIDFNRWFGLFMLTLNHAGFDLQFLERKEEMAAMYNATQLAATCDAWDEYVAESGLVQDDSGV